MPRALRVVLTALSFFLFFSGSMMGGLLLFPPLRLFIWKTATYRTVCSWLLHRGYPTFIFWMKVAGLIDYARLPALPELSGGSRSDRRAYVMIANHPTLIDVVYLLGWYRGLTTVVKSEWYSSAFFGALLRSTHYVPGPGYRGDEAGELRALERLVTHLEKGHPLLVFPEGTRSLPNKLRRFHRGAFEAAKRAGVPIVPIFIEVDRAFLTKASSPLRVPSDKARYRFRYLPVVDTRTDPRSASELRRDFQATYEAEYRASLARRVDVPQLAPPAPELERASVNEPVRSES